MSRELVQGALRIACVCALALLACEQPPSTAAAWLTLTQARPSERTEVFLNERVVLHFSEELDPASVHSGSVRILDSEGRAAIGAWRAFSDRLEFTPAPVLSADLSDGGYRPGSTYSVLLLGFPAPDGLRGRSGAILAASQRLEFRVVGLEARATRPLFEDASPTRGLPLVLASGVLAEGDPILLLGEEPVDPSSLEGADFELVKRSVNGSLARAQPVPLTARLVQNADKRAVSPTGATLIELRPSATPLEPGSYVLRLARGGRVDDLGGHAMMLVSPTSTRWLDLRVESGRRASRAGLAAHLESFASRAARSAQVWEDADGTASWSDTGRVEVRLPRICGDGRDGEAALAGALRVATLQATSIRVARERSAELEGDQPLTRLSAQASVRIDGRLVRSEPTSRASACDIEWLSALAASPLEAGEALEQLEREATRALVIIAGADLIVEGRLESSAPVVLIAGGRIRVSRQAVIEAPRVWFLDETTENLAHQVMGHRIGAGQRLSWRLARAERNVLRTPLRLAVISTSLPPGGAARFEFGPRVTLHHGWGRARVRYLGDRPVGSSSRSPELLVDDPALLVGSSTLRLLIELELFPGNGATDAALDAPWVDDVLIEYEPAREGRR